MFGLYENEGFKVTGVSDVQALQKKVMEQCNQMEPPVRAVSIRQRGASKVRIFV